jgi:medium-chain acyl-[acyl-carrier-protein] hydrolase
MISKWFSLPAPNPRATLRLFCFPYAGGRATIYHPWAALLPSHIELVAIELPGHGSRISEPPYRCMEQITDDLLQSIPALLDRPAAFWGYSMGALMSYELAQRLYRDHAIRLAHLFVAAHGAPHLPDPNPPSYDLPPAAFRQKLIALNGTPREALDHLELYHIVEPILRADFEVCDTYLRCVQPPLPCPITAFGGLQDPSVSRHDLAAWEHTGSHEFALHMVPGDHFFITTQRQTLIETLVRSLANNQPLIST